MASHLAVPALAGAGFELLFSDLLKVVLVVLKNNSQFKPSLERLQKMIEDMAPNIKRIETFNSELDQPQQLERLQGLMSDGRDLVQKCSKIHKYNCLKRPIYNKKLLKLEKDIRDHINIVLQLQGVADTKEIVVKQDWTLAGVNNVFSEVKQLGNQVSFGVAQLRDDIGKLTTTLSNVDRVDSINSNIRLAGVCSPPLLKVDPVGFEIPLSELSIKLLKDETSQYIVISAPGGCGKTTLATALCQLEDVKDKFNSNIFFLNVPKLRNLMVIVKMIFQHKDRQLPDFQSEEDAVNHLERLFKQIGPDPVLLVLDDVWPGSESILHKLKFRLENYKILVTSRYEFPSFGSSYKLKPLNHVDAVTFFQRIALPRDQQSYAPDQQTLEEMVKCCRGFPLVISVVGKSLCRKSAAEWRKRLRECSKAASILTEHEVLNCLQSTVEALNDKVVAKECFMDLGSFPEDQRIPATTLIDMWAELYNLDEDEAIANLHQLSDRNLIEVIVTRKDANEDDGSYNEHFVTQHDLLRELAIRESNSKGIEHRETSNLEINENKIHEWLTEENELSIRANSYLSQQMKHSHQVGPQCKRRKLRSYF
ncbi:PLANT BROAD-SPECTRUM MILDEW RESISTANCE PROTEIN RPW8 [Salix viminalis]|uniref:PLANT BROAD-SPECTRUM MILDEW RESISTANCE PROTEIN RPW8 n=1 Tax=Salix viminalis TaxID=40686 RepID=A0A9Q0SHY7_SALVM|nr:PLANT BROAD-SPECTRUM MILDEW RESISTANCE PROTEIN RPW8 [Salix viminalis]